MTRAAGYFGIVGDNTVIEEPAAIIQRLSQRRLYKSLSLYLGRRSGIQVPSVVLVEAASERALTRIAGLELPVMIRVDYSELPRRKPIGGIPLLSAEIVRNVCHQLLSKGMYPLFHQNLDRFSDLCSVGILLSRTSPEMEVEVVGRGFDAGDLRRGLVSPHESLRVNVIEESILYRKVISAPDYKQERERRVLRIRQLQNYISRVNRTGILSASLTKGGTYGGPIDSDVYLPRLYKPLGSSEVKRLCGICWTVQDSILPSLPHSDQYVVSLSRLPGKGWFLWDIYGHWYLR